ncbi:hypothetical protein [Methanoculleus thermophilus]|uniref:hypothetical protein n=1 Tax=Methanoculleus thermophilus TaxID=2200 RepID=UPI001379AF56|nr:hypothetical protein [Methanoculleus thermophilus]
MKFNPCDSIRQRSAAGVIRLPGGISCREDILPADPHLPPPAEHESPVFGAEQEDDLQVHPVRPLPDDERPVRLRGGSLIVLAGVPSGNRQKW